MAEGVQGRLAAGSRMRPIVANGQSQLADTVTGLHSPALGTP